jgi:2,3,4,5-tetrahydropyridine-2-carboxylate N-succinyltransferase
VDLRQTIERLYEIPSGGLDRAEALDAFRELKGLLNSGEVRAAECRSGVWRANGWVKKGILLAFRAGVHAGAAPQGGFPYFDRDTMAVKQISASDSVRVVPGGTAVRDGAFIGKGVVIMPPSYVNVGAYVGEQTMIDSHVLVGSCAQVGRRVHLSAGTQIGGVLEPVGSLPVVVEDDVLVGGNCGIYEGAVVMRRAVIGAGVIITGSTPLYDTVKQQVYRRSASGPLIVPEGAVVVPGSRPLAGPFAREQGLSVYTPVIVKYRDEKTDAASALEESLR